MKKYIAIATVLTVTLAACTGTKNTTSNNENGPTAVQQESSTPSSNKNMTASENASGGILDQTNGSSGAMNNVQTFGENNTSSFDYDEMYSELEMTDDQISSFRAAMKDFQNKQVNTANGEMMGSIESERTRQLENILSEVQMVKYEKWQADNN